MHRAEFAGERFERSTFVPESATVAPCACRARAMAPPIAPLAPVTSARLPVSSNIAFPVHRQASVASGRDIVGRADRHRLGAVDNALGETGQYLARADLDKWIDAVARPPFHSIRASAPCR